MKNAFYLLFFLLLGTTVIGCATKYIPKTMIEDTEENRQLVSVVENYRTAMESLDANRILELAAPNYYDTSGTPMPDDDVDLTGLKEFFQNYFSKIKALRLVVRVEKVLPDEEDENKMNIDFRYIVRYQMALPVGDLWKSDEELKRMTLVRQSEASPWLILNGM